MNVETVDKPSPRPMTSITANGSMHASEEVDLFIKELGQSVSPYVLNSTLDVLTLGYRCMELGYSFVWPEGSDPYFVLPNGSHLRLEVIDHIPYLRPGSSRCKPQKPLGRSCFACVGHAYQGHPIATNVADCSAGMPGKVPTTSRSQGVAQVPPCTAPGRPGSSTDPPDPHLIPDANPGHEASDLHDTVHDPSGSDAKGPSPAIDPAQIDTMEEEDEILLLQQRRDLIKEAQSMCHLLRHKKSNPYCEACRRGRMRRRPRFKNSFQDTAMGRASHR